MAHKYVRCRALAHSEKTKAVASDQYSCCKKHKEINKWLNKVLINNILSQKWHCGAIAMNDAKDSSTTLSTRLQSYYC